MLTEMILKSGLLFTMKAILRVMSWPALGSGILSEAAKIMEKCSYNFYSKITSHENYDKMANVSSLDYRPSKINDLTIITILSLGQHIYFTKLVLNEKKINPTNIFKNTLFVRILVTSLCPLHGMVHSTKYILNMFISF